MPLHTPAGADAPAAATRFSARGGRALAALPAALPPDHPALPGLAAAAWLHGVDLLAPDTWAQNAMLAAALQPLGSYKVRMYRIPQALNAYEDAKKVLLGEKEPSMQFTTPEELGELAVFFCSPASGNVRGVAWNMDGGWVAQ